ncbi:MAG: ABC transporter ATP-binding protein [Firmicutes bacterium]|nr:ABC transporter ATP-binding protein [Bacillota bacterium]
MSIPVLEVKTLRTYLFTKRGIVKAVDGISFTVNEGESLGVVGESGCGKTMTALSIMNLLPPTARIVEGKVLYKDTDLCRLEKPMMRKIRGQEIAMIFQNPMSSLNPVLTIGKQMTEAIMVHRHCSYVEARSRAIEMLERVRIPEPAQRLRQFPHEFSGGMCQRIMIAMALSCEPRVLLADEPTTALDVTIQAQIVELVKGLKEALGMTVIWVSHDLATIASLADHVLVMYAGHIVEWGPASYLYDHPRHPYTQGLLSCIPSLVGEVKDVLNTIEGQPPDLINPPRGCPYSSRCSLAETKCTKEAPPLMSTDIPGNLSACWRWAE